jgi:hypothetical protein
MTRRHQLLVTRFVILAAGCLTACQVDDRQVQLSGPVGEPDGLGAGASESDAGNTTAVVPGVDCSEATCISPGLDTSRPGSNQAAADAGALGNASADTCPGCLIDGSCVAAAAQDLQNACLICDPARNPDAWSANDEAVCDDGSFCTVEDVCLAGACSGKPRECDDRVTCNGVSACDEEGDACSPATNECGANGFCDAASGDCVSTCTGCLVDDVCVAANAERPGDPCFTCQPAVSTTTYLPAAGKPCGAFPSECSGQDTCDVQGICRPNHLPANSPCGSSASNACNQPDACDGAGNCQQRVSANGAACDDGAFCMVGDRCQGGQCLPTGARDCGLNQSCNEQADQCQCQGCQVGGTCFFDGDTNPTNACQICDVDRSRTAFSPNTGARCGAVATECSAQDTCDNRGQCGANNREDGTTCSGQSGYCRTGQCLSRQQFGTECTLANQCLTGFCRTWFLDVDDDGHGGTQQRTLCSPDPAMDTIRSDGAGLLIPIVTVNGQEFVALGDDCCDSTGFGGNLVFPGKVSPVTIEQTACPNRPRRDFDCDGVETCFDGNPPPCL